jgi:hypothetical protein
VQVAGKEPEQPEKAGFWPVAPGTPWSRRANGWRRERSPEIWGCEGGSGKIQGVLQCTAAADYFEKTSPFAGPGAFAGHRCS